MRCQVISLDRMLLRWQKRAEAAAAAEATARAAAEAAERRAMELEARSAALDVRQRGLEAEKNEAAQQLRCGEAALTEAADLRFQVRPQPYDPEGAVYCFCLVARSGWPPARPLQMLLQTICRAGMQVSIS